MGLDFRTAAVQVSASEAVKAEAIRSPDLPLQNEPHCVVGRKLGPGRIPGLAFNFTPTALEPRAARAGFGRASPVNARDRWGTRAYVRVEHAIVTMAAARYMVTTAEGVETETQREILRVALKCKVIFLARQSPAPSSTSYYRRIK